MHLNDYIKQRNISLFQNHSKGDCRGCLRSSFAVFPKHAPFSISDLPLGIKMQCPASAFCTPFVSLVGLRSDLSCCDADVCCQCNILLLGALASLGREGRGGEGSSALSVGAAGAFGRELGMTQSSSNRQKAEER